MSKAIYFFQKDFIFERRERREKERKIDWSLIADPQMHTPNRDSACIPVMYLDQESNPQPVGSQAGMPSTEPHQAGLSKSSSLIRALLRKIKPTGVYEINRKRTWLIKSVQG